MNLTEAYAKEIEAVFAGAAEEIGRFPAPFDGKGQALLEAANPLRANAGTNLITFLLPFWLKESASADEGLCMDLSVGNVFAMLQFFLLDDVMDEGERLGRAKVTEALVLGQLLQESFRRYYGRRFGTDAPLWPYYREYLAAWASAVSQEGTSPADPRDPSGLAGKSALVKLCAAGMLALAGREDRLPALEEALDLVLATLQLSDDWADWREDLADENRNAFLTLAREKLAWPEGQPLDERAVKRAVYQADAVGELAGIVRAYGERLRALEGVPAVLLIFYDKIYEGLRRDAEQAEETVIRLALGGGLSYILSKKEK